MKGDWVHYTPRQLAWIKRHRRMPRRDLHAAFVRRFGRRDVTVDNIKALCTRKGWKTGRDGRFVKGIVPANKGKKMPYNANSARTQFKKGGRTGRAAATYKPIGSTRLSKDGYPELKIHDGLPMQSRWRAVHLINWEKQNGPVPEGHCLKCRDGNRGNSDPSNWQLIPRALLPRLGGRFGRGYDDAPAELKPTIMAIAELEQQIFERRRSRRKAAA